MALTAGVSWNQTVSVPSASLGTGYVTFYFQQYYDVASNVSYIYTKRITASHSKFDGYYYSGAWKVGATITADGVSVANGDWTGSLVTAGVPAEMTGGTFPIVSGAIIHNTDGSKTTNISITINYLIGSDAGWVVRNKSATESVTLTTIPRKSSLTASNGTLGTAQTLTISRASNNFAHSIRYACGTSDVALVTKTTSTSVSFTPPLNLSKQNTTGTSVSITFTLYTFESAADDAKEVGRTTKTISCAIPASVKPSCSLSVGDVTGYADTFGGYVQGQSKLEIIVTPTLAYDSPIASYTVTADGKTYGYSDIETPALTNSGTLAVNATVKDQRGRSGSASQNITVLPYSPPAVTKLAVLRCNSDGSTNDMGTHCKVTYSFAITSLSSKNAKTIKLKYKKTSETAYTTVSLTSTYSATDATYVFAADESASYTVVIELADSFTSSSLSTSVSTAQVPMHLGSDGVSIAFGKLCEKEGYEFGKQIYDRFGTSIGGGLAAYTGGGDSGINPDTTLEELVLTSHTNAPQGLGTFYYIHTAFYNTKTATAARAQIAFPYNKTGSIYHRFYASGAWCAWTEYKKASDVVAKTELLDLVYPVNSYYIANHTTSPAELFGGTWYRVQSRFLYGCAESGTVGATGGASDVTLTSSQLPVMTGSIYGGHGTDGASAGGVGIFRSASGLFSTQIVRQYCPDFSTKAYWAGSSSNPSYHGVKLSIGGGSSHTNMPPYVNVAIWRRTA